MVVSGGGWLGGVRLFVFGGGDEGEDGGVDEGVAVSREVGGGVGFWVGGEVLGEGNGLACEGEECIDEMGGWCGEVGGVHGGVGLVCG